GHGGGPAVRRRPPGHSPDADASPGPGLRAAGGRSRPAAARAGADRPAVGARRRHAGARGVRPGARRRPGAGAGREAGGRRRQGGARAPGAAGCAVPARVPRLRTGPPDDRRLPAGRPGLRRGPPDGRPPRGRPRAPGAPGVVAGAVGLPAPLPPPGGAPGPGDTPGPAAPLSRGAGPGGAGGGPGCLPGAADRKRNVTDRQHCVRMVNEAWCFRDRFTYKRSMFWVLLLLPAWVVAGVTCTRLCLAAVRAAAADRARTAGAGDRSVTLYEAAFLSGGPRRVADVTLVAMARQRRLLLARAGWATVVGPCGRDYMERSVIGAIGPEGQSPIAPVRDAAATAEPVRGIADRLVGAGLAVPDTAATTIADAVRQVRLAVPVVLVLAVTALLLPVPADVPRHLVALWFALPLTLTLSCLA